MDDPVTPTTPVNAQIPLPRAKAFPWFAYLTVGLLSAVVLTAGLGMMFWWSGPGDLGVVREVRLTAKPGIDLKKIEEILDTPDYYLEIVGEAGSVKTETFEDTPIGNGLTFTLKVPARVVDVKEIRAWDANTLRKDDLVDRVDRPVRETDGEKFHFSLVGEVPPEKKDHVLGLGLAIAGGLGLAAAVLKFVRAQVV